ncbi:AraC family transcriptional regulator [Anaeromicropila herbilytica]|uniref:AraC family transcriptional regulator n=1 Tax=Anaeromicropila herbilytica TaxID=2785025 RepID=A0A7R7EIM0_9FIRM|nr:AraC family transcriptional regulator [Anaeromicropila herbilytica]BCN29132.1 AraC family transcriptional regulator [Anaeromicropila herbilytica]
MNGAILQQLQRITPEEQEILDGRNEIDRERYMDTSDMIVDSKKLLESGRLIWVRTHTRFVHFPKHKHNYVEVIYMCSGKTHHRIDGDEVILNQGELLFLNQNATQEILPASKEDIAINFIILPEFFDQALHMMEEEENLIRDFVIGCLCSDDRYTSYLHFKVSDILPIQNLIENLIWTIMNNQQNKRSINQITMGLLFLQLMNHTDKVTAGKDYIEQEIMLTVLRYIEENYKDGELSELAHHMNYDLYWLSRMIKKLTGKNYTELLQTKRLNQAAYYLQHTTLTIADIGLSVGYDNLSYFYRIFKQKYRMSPKEYRTQFSKK